MLRVNNVTATKEVIIDSEKAVIVLAKTLSSSSILLQLIETISACPDTKSKLRATR